MTPEDLTEGEKKRLFTEKLRGYIDDSRYSMAEVGRKVGIPKRDTFHKQVELINRMSDKTIYDICEVLGLSERQRTELLMLAGYAIPPSVEQIIREAATAPEQADYWHSWRETAGYTQYLVGNQTLTVPLEKLQPDPDFVGREEDIHWVLDHLQPGHIVTLVGHGGIGKTQIAAKAMDHLAPGEGPPERFPDGIVFYNFYGKGKHRAEIALEHIFTRFGEKPSPALDEAVLNVLSNKRVLLWLEGAERADNLNRVLDVRGKQCGVLITSQKRSDIKEYGRDILRLPRKDSDTLLFSLAGQLAHHSNATTRIYELVGEVTLALALAGGHLRDLQDADQLEDYLTWLKTHHLAPLHRADHRRQSVYVLMKRSVELVRRQLGEGTHLMLAIMGILAYQPLDVTMLAAALDVQPYDVKQILEGLVDYNVLSREGNRYMVRHNLIYDYIRKYLHAPYEAVTQLVAYYCDLAVEQTKRGAEGFRRLDPELAHMVTVVTCCVARKQWTEAQQLTKAVNKYLDLQGYRTDHEAVLRAGLTAAKALKDQDAEAARLNNLGVLSSRKRDHDKGFEYFGQALQIRKQLGDRHGLANAYGNLGVLYLRKGEYDEAIKYFEQARPIFEQVGDIDGLAKTLDKIGRIYVHRPRS